MRVKKAVIPAAGLGTRFLPATKAVPKELLPIVDVPIIQHIVEEAVASGIEDIILVTGRGKNALLDHFDRTPELEDKLESLGETDLLKRLRKTYSLAKIISVRQQEPKGLGDAVLCAKTFIGDEPFAVLLGDDLIDSSVPCTKQMAEVAEKHDKSVAGLMRISTDDVELFGMCGGHEIEERVIELDTMVEKPSEKEAPSNMAIVGRYVLKPSIFRYLEELGPGKDGALQLTDAMARMMKVEGFLGYEFAGDRYDAGDTVGFLKANFAFALKRRDIAERLEPFVRDLITHHSSNSG